MGSQTRTDKDRQEEQEGPGFINDKGEVATINLHYGQTDSHRTGPITSTTGRVERGRDVGTLLEVFRRQVRVGGGGQAGMDGIFTSCGRLRRHNAGGH
ncbi:hypothetical protein Pmani_005742 [Petrolisthes manimaculis]|uniref:Uncharacterized protein n=1 Tax=Petrolisthes manimaculis TaxID=1843537 RepID=A0AAE1UML7_9EUCA|nr:hypothetical protein Pmani_005742 [Petrolisthes manimaculis]